ncbi:MAG: (d)CMP kinase [Anaerolineae bacterium]
MTSPSIPIALPRLIAIDGPAGSGKTTVGFALAQEFGYLLIDTGAYYRAVTIAAQRARLDPSSAQEQAFAELARSLRIVTKAGRHPGEHYRLFLENSDGEEEITEAIRAAEVEAQVSQIAAMGGVRAALNAHFRSLAGQGQRVIMVGRDIGSVVLPEAEIKLYLDASPSVRAVRRQQQSGSADVQGVQAALEGRDKLDTQREIAPLRLVQGAHYLDTDQLDITSVIAQVKQLLLEWAARAKADQMPPAESPPETPSRRPAE